MNAGAKIAIVAGLAVVTCAVAAKPITSYVAQGQYDSVVQELTQSKIPYENYECTVAHTETNRTFDSREADIKVSCGDLTLDGKLKTTFGVFGAESIYEGDFNNSSLMKASILGKAGSIEKDPESTKITFDYLAKTINVDNTFKAITHWASERAAEKVEAKNVKILASIDVAKLKEAPIDLIKSGNTSGNYNISADKVVLSARNDAVEFSDVKSEGFLLPGNVVAKQETHVGSILVTEREQEIFTINNVALAYDSLVGDNDTYGLNFGLNFDYLSVPQKIAKNLIPEFKEELKIDNFNLAFEHVNLSSPEFTDLYLSSYSSSSFDKLVEKYFNDTSKKVNLKLKDLSFKLNNNPAKLDGTLVSTYRGLAESRFTNEINFEANISLHQNLVKTLMGQMMPMVDGIVQNGMVSLENDFYNSKVNIKDNHILLNGKPLM